MYLFPAIDLYEGKAVRLTRGDYAQMTVYSADPPAFAEAFAAAGAEHLHLVDLEGAKRGDTPNFDAVRRIVAATKLKAELGGGVRSEEVIERYLDAGVWRVILGTAALCGAAAFGFTWLCSPWIVGLFLTPDAPAYAIAVQGLPWFAAGYPFFGINVVTIGYYQSIERGRLATGLTVLRGIVLMTFCFLLLPRIAGVTGIWLAVPVAEALETLLLVYLLRSRRFAFA